MPQVFTGKVMIPGDKIDEYFKLMEQAEKEREPFRQYLNKLSDEFDDYLSMKYGIKTVRKHSGIISMFIEFICRYTDVQNIEDITRGMVNTHFKKWYKRKVWDSATPDDIRVALKKFFQFLEQEKGIKNMKVLESFK